MKHAIKASRAAIRCLLCHAAWRQEIDTAPARRRTHYGGRRILFAHDVPGNRLVVALSGNPMKKDRAKSKSRRDGNVAEEGKVRPAEVSRARELIAQPGYPPPEIIAAVATKLAQQWPRPERRRSF